MAIKKIAMRPPVYVDGAATYPDTVYPKTSSDMVVDPDTGVTVKESITALAAQTAFHDLDGEAQYIITLRKSNGIPQIVYTEVAK